VAFRSALLSFAAVISFTAVAHAQEAMPISETQTMTTIEPVSYQRVRTTGWYHKNNFKPVYYGGVEYMYTTNSVDNEPKVNGKRLYAQNFNGANVFGGARFGKYFGVELGFNATQAKKQTINTTVSGITFRDSSTQYYTASADLMGYLPLGKSGVELLGLVGVGNTWATGEVTSSVGNADIDDSAFGLRYGGGAQYIINEKLAVRGLARRTEYDSDGATQAANQFSLGAHYLF
jgi:opacity protein-like surface antigen